MYMHLCVCLCAQVQSEVGYDSNLFINNINNIIIIYQCPVGWQSRKA